MLGYHGYYTYYIHWASKFATSANIGNKAAYKRRSKTSPNWNHFRRVQETISWVPIMLARCLASLLTFSCLAFKSSSACCCARKYASEFCRDFLSPSASCRSTADWCLSACSWDWRSRTDSGSEFEELVPAILASNSNTTSPAGLWGFLTVYKIVFITFLGDQHGCLTILNLICITFSSIA